MTRWTMPDIARVLGLRVETVHGYRSRKQMPAPTGVIGRTPYWTDATIGPWIERQKARRETTASLEREHLAAQRDRDIEAGVDPVEAIAEYEEATRSPRAAGGFVSGPQPVLIGEKDVR